MITMPDKQLTDIVSIMLRIAEAILESAVRKNLFNRSDVEWFCTDVGDQLTVSVQSELALAVLKARLDKMFDRLTDPDLPMQMG